MRPIKRSAGFEDLVKTLNQQPHYDTGKPIFATIRGLMRFAATLGYDQGERKPLDSDVNESDGRPFARHDQTLDLMLLLALAETKSSDIFLSDDDEQIITIFEEYAQAGFEILEKWLNARPDDLYGDQSILNGLAALGYIDERAASTIDDVSDAVEF